MCPFWRMQASAGPVGGEQGLVPSTLSITYCPSLHCPCHAAFSLRSARRSLQSCGSHSAMAAPTPPRQTTPTPTCCRVGTAPGRRQVVSEGWLDQGWYHNIRYNGKRGWRSTQALCRCSFHAGKRRSGQPLRLFRVIGTPLAGRVRSVCDREQRASVWMWALCRRGQKHPNQACFTPSTKSLTHGVARRVQGDRLWGSSRGAKWARNKKAADDLQTIRPRGGLPGPHRR